MDKYPKERDERYRANNDDPTMDYYQESKDTQQRAEEVTGLTLEARGHAVAVRGLLRDKAEKYDYIHLRVQGASTRATKGSSSSAHEGPREVNRQRGGRRGGGRGGGGERGGGKGKSKGKDKGKEKDRR